MQFYHSRKKVKRAVKHITDLNELLANFSSSNFYAVSIQVKRGENHLRFDINKSGFSMIDAALIIGDALHNLKSAIDLLYCRAVDAAVGSTKRYTRFPFRDNGKELENALENGLKKQAEPDNGAVLSICRVLLDVIKPYPTGNPLLCALHDLNIRDKHELLVPVFDMMIFRKILLEDDKQVSFWAEDTHGAREFIMDESCSNIKLKRHDHLTVKDKGHAATTILFNVGVALQSEPVIPSLYRITEEVTRTIDAFEELPLYPFATGLGINIRPKNAS
jgi:hypothetical protein